MTERVRAFMREHQMLTPGEPVLAAVSGGGDSMCLLHLLWREGYAVQAATYDHGIRPQSAQDAAFVESWCRAHDIPCHVERGDVPRWAKEQGLGLEEAARALRYAFLRETAQKVGAAKIATAHNADDNAETLLLHLLRGSGLNGLGGIPPVRGNLIRPLLTTSRAEIDAYLERWDIPHVEDSTNADTTYRRNYLRHEVLPLLKAQNPNLLEGLSRTMRGLRQDSDYLEQQAAEIADRAVPTGGGLSYPVGELAGLHPALANRVVQCIAARLNPDVVLTAAQREAVLALCRSDDPGGRYSLPGGLVARRMYDRLVLGRKEPEESFQPVPLSPGNYVIIGNRWLECQWATCPEGKFNQPDEFYLIPCPGLILRPRRTGDAITLPARDRKTVKKLLIDSKIPRAVRDKIAVFDVGGRVAALDGFGADRAFLPKPGERCWKITISNARLN
ncbi:MAG: tRNA lysidine(34) synthetase TilS [Clostridiales bacterium]|nr:tRNA lysidine(34) synthetase TilS [Clostridiales bacterium]